MTELDKSRFIISNQTTIALLKCQEAFNGLTKKEKLYAHYLWRAGWCGSLICLLQASPESPGIYLLLMKIFCKQSVSQLEELALKSCDFTTDEFQAFLMFSSAFLANLGNYKSFGDTKFIPDLPESKFEKLVKSTVAYQVDSVEMEKLWKRVGSKLFSLTPREQQLGLGEKGISGFFSLNCDVKDAEIAQEFMTAKDLSAYNTRLFKYDENGKSCYEIRLASAETSSSDSHLPILGLHDFTPKDSTSALKVKVTRGDYSPLLSMVVKNLEKAKKFASNETEIKMLESYVRSFKHGSIEAHKEGSRHWIRNKGPVIELYIGFIESYRDPFGVRGEYEAFVAMVNKDMSARLGELVSRAEHFLPLLPWPSAYEKDEFQLPDFTSLDVLSFSNGGIPAGINIPNYDDIRQVEGYKNVSLGNVLASSFKDHKLTFLCEKDEEFFKKLHLAAFEVQVGLHELLGHGSGKLFQRDANGKFNFDKTNVKNCETGKEITSWYEPGEQWNSKFKSLAGSYEECRAECVGIFLCLSSEILSIFGHKGHEADDIIYVNWLSMVRSGLLGLEMYSPENVTWGQAHMQARFVILRVLLMAEENLVTIEKTIGSDGQPDLIIKIDRSKINTVGKTAIGNFLKKLQLYKSTGDYESGKAMFDRYSDVNDHQPPHFLSLRTIVLKRKNPRKMFVQCNTVLKGDEVNLVEYDPNPSGMIKSFVDRFPDDNLQRHLEQLWMTDEKHFHLH